MIKYGVEFVLGEEKEMMDAVFLTHQKKPIKQVANC